MKNIFKYLLIALVGTFIITSCNNEADRDWTTTEAAFKLHDTTLGSSVLYPSMESNPFILTWDKASNVSGEYSVVLSAKEDFTNKVLLGKTNTNTFKTTIGTLNNALLQAGFNPYSAQPVYMRIEAGSVVSNTISFSATTYPVNGPKITAPTAGTSLILDSANPDALATTITWDDATYGVSVSYLVEIAAAGSTEYYPLGTTQNSYYLEVTNLLFDQTVLKTGAVVNVASNIDVRVTATTESTGGTIEKSSEIVQIKVTPYVLESWLYAPGAYQSAPNWTPETAEALLSSTSNGIYIGYINFPEPNSEFKITTERNWTNNYGTNDNVNLIYNGGGNIKATDAGYQKLTVDTNALTFSLEAHSWGLIGDSTPSGWDNDTDMVWNYTNQTWEISSIPLTVGKIKFRLNNGWDTNYGGSGGNLSLGGADISISEAGNYKIVMDIVNLKYSAVKL